jgi:3,4-dihydroxy-2-butanone 4-phosphate synthase
MCEIMTTQQVSIMIFYANGNTPKCLCLELLWCDVYTLHLMMNANKNHFDKDQRY